jgi:hypothetical protein
MFKWILIVAVIVGLMFGWGLIGMLWVMYLDIFGRRYNYDEDYPLSFKQIMAAGPIVWIFEYKKYKRVIE